jgi:hypothetical protein
MIGHKTVHLQEGNFYVYFLQNVPVAGLLIKRMHNRLHGINITKEQTDLHASVNRFSDGISSKHMSLGFIGNNFPLKVFHSYTYICKHNKIFPKIIHMWIFLYFRSEK